MKLSSSAPFWVSCLVAAGIVSVRAQTAPMTLRQLVEPSSVFRNQDGPVPFALYAFIEFQNLEELFVYIDGQAGRWKFDSAEKRKLFADGLARKGVESRVISMIHPTPREILVTHTGREVAAAVDRIRSARSGWIYRGENWSLDTGTYRDFLLQVRERWVSSLNCWSASSSIAGRVLSNWYVIEEGIPLFGATYDSTEHFWQAIKFHPEITLADLSRVLERLESIDWTPWLERLSKDQETYLANTYAVEFLRHNLTGEKLRWFRSEVDKYAREYSATPVRQVQQRGDGPWKPRFTPFEEKVLWGDLADVFHLIYYFGHLDGGRLRSAAMNPVLDDLVARHFDGVYLAGYEGGKVGFISPEYRQLMLEIWKVKFLKMERFREVLETTRGRRLLHFLNDGDSPDIPIPIYVGFLQKIREMALEG